MSGTPTKDSSTETTICARCETVNKASAGRCRACKSFLKNNLESRTLGLYQRTKPAELTAQADQLEAGIIQDLGGVENLSTLERAYAAQLRDIDVTIRLLAVDIARNNLFTPGGRVRDVYDKYLAGLDRFDRFANRLGLKRRARRVDWARTLSGLDQ